MHADQPCHPTQEVAPVSEPAQVLQLDATGLCVLKDTQERVMGQKLTFVPLHRVLTDNTCSCGHPLCFHPGKHGAKNLFPKGKNYTTSKTCGSASLPMPFNLGVIADGCIILNIDKAYGGFDTFNATFPSDGHRGVPDTWTVGTPGGGLHLWFRLPPRSELKSSFIFLGPGLSVLSGPSVYGIVPPSIGLNQAPYTWESPPDVGIAPIPGGMLPTIVEADATEARGWHVRMTRDQIAARVHADFCARFFKVDYDVFESTWLAVAEFLEKARIRPESFVLWIRHSWMKEGLQPEDLLTPEVLAVRDASIGHVWPTIVEFFYDRAALLLSMYMRHHSLLNTRLYFAKVVPDVSSLFCVVIALYGFPAGAFAEALKDKADIALDELNDCDLLGRELQRQYFVHPEELRCRLARFIEVQAS